MRKIIMLVCIVVFAGTARAQVTIPDVLYMVEQNNVSLEARRKLMEAQVLEARTGNSLDNPDIEYIHAWGKPSALGKTGELTLTQAFDFPTVYGHRNKLARIQAEQYGHEYAAYRQQVLLDVYNVCIDIIAIKQKQEFLGWAVRNAEQAVEVFETRTRTGDAGVLELNSANYQLVAAKTAYNMGGIELATAITRLSNLNGGRDVDLTDDKFPFPLEELPPFAEMAERYEAGSPQMLAAWKESQAAAREVLLSRAESLPKLKAGYRYEFSTGEKFNGVVVGMSVPMFGNRNNVKRARAQSAYAEARLTEQRTDMLTELGELYSRAGLLSQTVSDYSAILDHDRSSELLAKALLAGHISITEYFSQLQPVYEINIAMIELMREYQQTLARLYMINL